MHLAPRPEVQKLPSSAVIAFFAVLKHPSSAVVALYERWQGDTISTRGYVARYLIHYTNIVPLYRIY